MRNYLKFPLTEKQLHRLNFEEPFTSGYWTDIGELVSLKYTQEGMQQYVLDENDNQIDVGIPLKTVDDLIKRYNSFTGYELKYWDKDYPQTAQ